MVDSKTFAFNHTHSKAKAKGDDKGDEDDDDDNGDDDGGDDDDGLCRPIGLTSKMFQKVKDLFRRWRRPRYKLQQ